MSDKDYHFESKANVDTFKIYPQLTGIIYKNDYNVIKGRPRKGVRLTYGYLFFCRRVLGYAMRCNGTNEDCVGIL
ncbi:hypothetical protein V6N11_070032 [Hibiscus sabdariffa]|uniref:Uncharacterized protein n=1 Tax=Hibiscus sabdariffa TaxID=183260 RepID=A0ABR2QDY0_9ROSI